MPCAGITGLCSCRPQSRGRIALSASFLYKPSAPVAQSDPATSFPQEDQRKAYCLLSPSSPASQALFISGHRTSW